ncbi:hypothetical protein KI809_18655 [Geobacter pelophilus]|uniref:Uncharacterized protein n=1 Tax=Geoanaerobacter pelophilus TaxID=60036 RepID=A0AAW4L5T1_9BACT|nr:hypothetical protein [Geoanaerobacter pelophilus]MBT0666333.1 hypothetical protein [Geoanaerobacter pelophilus]
MALDDLCTAETADQGIDIEIFHPGSGESLGIFIRMLGSDSEEYIEAERKITNRQKEKAKRTRDFTAGMDYDQSQAALVEKMAACFVSWKEVVPGKDGQDPAFKPTIELKKGEELEATKNNFKKIISNRGFFWLRQQVQQGMDNVTNFLPPARKSSESSPRINSDTKLQEKTE